MQQQIEQDAKAGDAAEKKAKARLDALQVQIDQQEAAVAAARSRAAEAEAEASKQAARREEEAADVVLESVAASSSFVLETGPLDGASARGAGAQPRKAGKVCCDSVLVVCTQVDVCLYQQHWAHVAADE